MYIKLYKNKQINISLELYYCKLSDIDKLRFH